MERARQRRRWSGWSSVGHTTSQPGRESRKQSVGRILGGPVESDPAGKVTWVRLISADGVILEDTVEEGVILFLAERPVDLPLSAELYDQTGRLVAHHVAIRARTRPPDGN